MSTRQSIVNVFVGVLISLFNAISQFLTIYFILNRYGSQFNGFVRLLTSTAAIFSTADSALGIATVLMLVKPIMKLDWISANEIYSSSVKRYKRSAIISTTVVAAVALLYPLFVSVGGINGMFIAENWKNIGLRSTGTDTQFIDYWQLILIALFLGMKFFVVSFFFSASENVLAADNHGAVSRVIILLTDTLISALFLILLSIDSIYAFIPFIVFLLYSPIRGLLIFIYVKRKYSWLRNIKSVTNYKLKVVQSKISIPNIGVTLIQNTDIALVSIFFGLDASSFLSLYLIIALNVRLLMSNFISSFRQYFSSLISKNGRIYWQSYVKYELYTYIVAGFTFINMTVLSPYFVNALYGDIAQKSIDKVSNLLTGDSSVSNSLDFIFNSFWFSGLFSGSMALALMSEAQINLIQAKGQTGDISKFQNSIGGIYLGIAILGSIVFGVVGVGGNNNIVYGILFFYILKIVVEAIRYLYLWKFVWKFVTYNSSFSYVFQNYLNLVVSLFITVIFALILNKTYDVRNVLTSGVGSLMLIFLLSLSLSILLIFIASSIISPKLFMGIFKNLPVINEFVGKVRKEKRKQRLEENNINMNDLAERGDLARGISFEQFDGVNITQEYSSLVNEINDAELLKQKSKDLIYKIKG